MISGVCIHLSTRNPESRPSSSLPAQAMINSTGLTSLLGPAASAEATHESLFAGRIQLLWAKRNPYARRLKKQVTDRRSDHDTIGSFKWLSRTSASRTDAHQPVPSRLRDHPQRLSVASRPAAKAPQESLGHCGTDPRPGTDQVHGPGVNDRDQGGEGDARLGSSRPINNRPSDAATLPERRPSGRPVPRLREAEDRARPRRRSRRPVVSQDEVDNDSPDGSRSSLGRSASRMRRGYRRRLPECLHDQGRKWSELASTPEEKRPPNHFYFNSLPAKVKFVSVCAGRGTLHDSRAERVDGFDLDRYQPTPQR